MGYEQTKRVTQEEMEKIRIQQEKLENKDNNPKNSFQLILKIVLGLILIAIIGLVIFQNNIFNKPTTTNIQSTTIIVKKNNTNLIDNVIIVEDTNTTPTVKVISDVNQSIIKEDNVTTIVEITIETNNSTSKIQNNSKKLSLKEELNKRFNTGDEKSKDDKNGFNFIGDK